MLVSRPKSEKLRVSLAATAVALALHGVDAGAQFSNAFAVGDSLSDAGQYGARFTTNPGLVAPQYLAQRYLTRMFLKRKLLVQRNRRRAQ